MIDHTDVLAAFSHPQLLKRGGQKVAYRASSPQFGTVAVKIGTYTNVSSLERAKREAETLRRLESPYYPRQYDFRPADGNRFVVVEEYIVSKSF